jgi:hypothetical protein
MKSQGNARAKKKQTVLLIERKLREVGKEKGVCETSLPACRVINDEKKVATELVAWWL